MIFLSSFTLKYGGDNHDYDAVRRRKSPRITTKKNNQTNQGFQRQIVRVL